MAARAAFCRASEGAGQLAAGLSDDGQTLPGIHRGDGDATRFGELGQVVGLALGIVEVSAERVARGEDGGGASLLVGRPSSRALARTSVSRCTRSETPVPRA